MERLRWVAAAGLLGFCLTGCGGSQTNAPEANAGTSAEAGASVAATPTDAESASLVAATGSPDQAVAVYLESIKACNEKRSEAMLTQLARKKMTELGDVAVQPQAGETFRYEVGEVELIGPEKDGAQVACKWTEADVDGETITDDVVWLLRREAHGWRIAGLATKVFENEPPLILNYEDPADVLRKKDLVEAEIARRTAEQNSQAQQSQAGQLPPR